MTSDERLDPVHQLVLLHLVDRLVKDPSDLVAGPERLVLGLDENTGNAADASRLLGIRDILRVAEIGETDADHNDPPAVNRVSVSCQIGSCPSGRHRSVKIEDEAEAFVRRQILRRLRDLCDACVADQVAEPVRDALRGAHPAVVEKQRLDHVLSSFPLLMEPAGCPRRSDMS